MSKRLQDARGALRAVLEVYTPLHGGRGNAIKAMGDALTEFEAAVREDAGGTDTSALQAELQKANEDLSKARQSIADLEAFAEALEGELRSARETIASYAPNGDKPADSVTVDPSTLPGTEGNPDGGTIPEPPLGAPPADVAPDAKPAPSRKSSRGK